MSADVDLMASLKPGDPNPTPGYAGDCPAEGYDTEDCEKVMPWFCTRDVDHPDQHVASGITSVCHVWPQDGDS